MIPGFLKHFWKTYGSWENVRDNRKDYFNVETKRSQECAYEISEAMRFKWLQAEKYVTGGVHWKKKPPVGMLLKRTNYCMICEKEWEEALG